MNMNHIHQIWLAVIMLLLVILGLSALVRITQGIVSLNGFSCAAISGLMFGAAGLLVIARLNKK